MRAEVIIVTDPMCSWCWGMAQEIARARRDAPAEFEFNCLLGGINTDSAHAVTDFARARLADVWRRVSDVTGAPFGSGLPAGDFVYNSQRACVAVEAFRELTRAPPFEYLHRLQVCFFLEGTDVTDTAVLIREASALGVDADRFVRACQAPQTLERVRAGFVTAKAHGTSALPSVLIDVRGTRRLVAGGYVDAPTLIESLHGHLRRIEDP